jgi:hypothetical protein
VHHHQVSMDMVMQEVVRQLEVVEEVIVMVPLAKVVVELLFHQTIISK